MRRLLLLSTALTALLLIAPAGASALCNGLAATVGGATSGSDTLNGTSGDDVIEGLGGNDSINGAGGNDTICGGDGDDTVDGGLGADHLEGGTTGETNGDTVTFASLPTSGSPSTSGIFGNLSTGTATTFLFNPSSQEVDSLAQFENLTGSNASDVLTGDGNANTITGLNLPDGILGGGGDDHLVDDTDASFFQDQVRYTDATGGVSVNLTTGTASGAGVGTDTISTGFGSIDGSNFDDTLVGTAGDDTISGESGNDVIETKAGGDFANGLGGTDTISYANETGPVVTSDLNSGANNNVTAPGGTDTIFQVENLIGSAQNDQITGGSVDNVFDGRGGEDQLNGRAGGSDTAAYGGLSAGVSANLATGTATGQGSDTLTNMDNLIGSSQNDTLTGNGSDNVLDGGSAGSDTVRFDGVAAGMVASLGAGTATGQGTDTLTNLDNLGGSSSGDSLNGNDGPNTIDGGASGDTAEG